MKKIIRIVSVCLMAVLLMTMLSSCTNIFSRKSKFVGTWMALDSEGEETGEKLVLANDGTGSMDMDGIGGSLTWSLNKGKLSMTVSVCGMSESSEYSYKFSGNKLTLTDEDGETTVYRKNKSK